MRHIVRSSHMADFKNHEIQQIIRGAVENAGRISSVSQSFNELLRTLSRTRLTEL